MNSEMSVMQAPATNGKLRLFSLYVDFPASVSARWAACAIARLAGPDWQTPTEMWKIDSLKASESIRQMMTGDAAKADVIIIAVSSLEPPPDPALIKWLDLLAALPAAQPAPCLLIGLLGDNDTKTGELDRTVKPLIRCAQQAGRDFIWHWMGETAMSDSDWLAENIKDLLARKLAMFDERAFLQSSHF
jgi:hypothetical protein